MLDTLTDERDLAAARHLALLRALRMTVGASHVRTDGLTLERYGRSTAARGTRPLAVVYPASHGEVVGVMKVALAHGTPVYPVSTGKNWGYGDACAPSDGQLLLDLSRMNRIVQVEADLAYAIIEPGVTQQQLSDYLRERGLPLWVDCTGAGPDTSLMGNILERGFGHSPYGNRLQHVSGMQVVLAGGEVLHTGFGHYPQARSTHVFPYGVGPLLDGLFTQSNLGIVTRLAIWLMPAVDCVNHFLCSVDDHAAVGPLIDALRPLRLNGTLRSIVHIGNDLRVISGGKVFPRELAGGAASLPGALRAQMREAAGAGAWTASGALYGSAAQVRAARSALRDALRGTGARLRFVDAHSLRAGALAARLLGGTRLGHKLRAQVALGEALLGMNRGIPSGRFLAGAYWRRRGGLPGMFPAGANPAQDQCGMLWVSPILPMRGADALALDRLVSPLFAQFGFDLFVTYSMINERALGAVLTIAFDKQDEAETARAHACYQAVFAAVMKHGYIPYRVGPQSMAALDPDQDTYWKTVARIRQALDPAGLIAPGRYQPAQALPPQP